MEKFSLSELAHLNECLFPGEFKNDLISQGVPPDDALCIAQMGITGSPQEGMNILDVYRGCSSYAPYLVIINQYVSDWCDKNS